MQRTTPPDLNAAIAHCDAVIREGSKSFSLAARLFDRQTMHAAFSLYGWCRYCDDQIDLCDGEASARYRLQALRRQTEGSLTGQLQTDPVFVAFQHVTKKYAIPAHYPLELLEGMAMDVRAQRYETLEELLLYCYRVAGTVGLMMAHVMGVSDERALRHAADMGIAMQLTNIARDIVEDCERGRIYLPLAWLAEAELPLEGVGLVENRAKLAAVVRRLLAEADSYYASGRTGLRYLPLRCGCAVAAAQKVYADIGRMVLARGLHAWDTRTYTSKMRKVVLVAAGIGHMGASIPMRAVRPWSAVPIKTVWRFPVPQGEGEGA